jgi:hypothetical protein
MHPIPAVYREDARPSHFQGVRDITLITLMVGKSLISRGMYPQGLYKSVGKLQKDIFLMKFIG